MTGHTYSEWTVITEPDGDTPGERTRTCAACGDVQTETFYGTGYQFETSFERLIRLIREFFSKLIDFIHKIC